MKKLIYWNVVALLVAVLAYGGAFAHATKVGVLDMPVYCLIGSLSLLILTYPITVLLSPVSSRKVHQMQS